MRISWECVKLISAFGSFFGWKVLGVSMKYDEETTGVADASRELPPAFEPSYIMHLYRNVSDGVEQVTLAGLPNDADIGQWLETKFNAGQNWDKYWETHDRDKRTSVDQ